MIKPNREAEASVIGILLMNPERMNETALMLSAEDFLTPVCRKIYEGMEGLSKAGKGMDTITLLSKLGEGYKPALVGCCETAPHLSHLMEYVEIVRETARRTRGFAKASELLLALEEGEELQGCQERALAVTKALDDPAGREGVDAAEGFYRFYAGKMKPKTYLKTGFARLDRYLYLDLGDYLVVGGRPSAGKTAFTLQMMLHMARDHKVIYFSLETSAEKIFDRLVSSYTQTKMTEIKRQEIRDWERIAKEAERFGELKFQVVEAAGYTVAQVRAKAIQLGAEVIFIDYLSLLRGEGKSLYERVTNISMELHTLAQREKIAVIALSQLSRAGKGEPDMTSLRESGQIEQDADAILLLHAPDLEGRPEERELHIVKNKEGSTGVLLLRFYGEYQKFLEVEHGRG